jgi:hypothetical protein
MQTAPEPLSCRFTVSDSKRISHPRCRHFVPTGAGTDGSSSSSGGGAGVADVVEVIVFAFTAGDVVGACLTVKVSLPLSAVAVGTLLVVFVGFFDSVLGASFVCGPSWQP